MLACPACGEHAPPPITVPNPVWFTCPRCGERTPRMELDTYVDKAFSRGLVGSPPPARSRTDYATGPDYPRPWCYVGSSGNGDPILSGAVLSIGGTFDSANLAAIAKFPMVTINTTPFSDFHPQIISMLRALNPRIIIAWYDTFMQRFTFLNPGTMWKAEYDAFKPYELFDTGGNSFPESNPNNFWIDTGDTQTAQTAIWQQYAINGRDADGVFLDYAHGLVRGGGFVSGLPVDPVAAGYADQAAMDTATTNALDNCVTAFKSAGIVLGNGNATAGSKAKWSGELFEGWPNSQGGASNLDTALAVIAPTMGAGIDGGGSALLKLEDFSAGYGATWNKNARYVLGCATLYGGYAFIGPDRALPPTYTPYYPTLWADEWSVTPQGVHDTTGVHVGWLGRPTELPAKDVTSGIWVRRFTRGVVCVNGTSGSLTVDLGTNYKRITGLRDVTVNNGATEQNVSVGAKDAVFLLKI